MPGDGRRSAKGSEEPPVELRRQNKQIGYHETPIGGDTMHRVYQTLSLTVLAVAVAVVMMTAVGDDRSESTAPVGKAKDATDADLLCRHWVHSREEEKSEDKGQLFRPAGSKKFPRTRFRMAYKFSKDGDCEWMWLSPRDAHKMKSGTWSLDSEDSKILRIDKGEQGGIEAFRIMELSKDALRLERIKPEQDRDRQEERPN